MTNKNCELTVRSNELNSTLKNTLCTNSESNIIQIENVIHDVLALFNSNCIKGNAIYTAAKIAINKSGIVIVLTGFLPDNLLRALGDINFWLDFSDYGIIDIGHKYFRSQEC